MIGINLDFNLFNNQYFFYERLLVLLASLIPTIILIIFVLFADRKSKEPTKNIVICILSGILTIALAKYLEELIMPYIGNNIILTYIWATIEEVSKIAIFMLFILDNKHYDDIFDGVIYMTLIALSFAGIENIMYAFSESTISDSISLAIMRDFTTIPLHVICGVVIGFYISLSNFSANKQKKSLNLLLAVIIPSFMHGTFNMIMNLLSQTNINYNNSIEVFIYMVIPLIIVVLLLCFIAYKYSSKAIKLNDVYISNEEYEDKYNYLMTYYDYANSIEKYKRIKYYKMTTFGGDKNA